MSILDNGRVPKKMHRYVHMLPEDQKVWDAYLDRGHDGFLNVWYDIHVGNAVVVPPGSPAYLLKVAEAVTRKRIDVIAELDRELWIIELKPVCTSQALGQVTVYRELFGREYSGTLPTVPVVICFKVEEDVLETVKRLGVHVIALHGVLS